MAASVDEQSIIDSLRLIPVERWGEVLSFLESLYEPETPIRTGQDLIQSGLVGLWKERDDLGAGHGFPRQLLRGAEDRPGADDAAGH